MERGVGRRRHDRHVPCRQRRDEQDHSERGSIHCCNVRALRQAAMGISDRNVESSISPTRITSNLWSEALGKTDPIPGGNMRQAMLSILPCSHRQRVLIVAVAMASFVFASCAGDQSVSVRGLGDEYWVGTWSASPMAADSVPGSSNSGFANQTVRHITHVSIAGNQLRVRLSNAYGTRPLNIGATHVALQSSGASIVSGSDRALTFNGNRSITIPAGALVLSDPVDFDVTAFADLAVSVYFLGPPVRLHGTSWGCRPLTYLLQVTSPRPPRCRSLRPRRLDLYWRMWRWQQPRR